MKFRKKYISKLLTFQQQDMNNGMEGVFSSKLRFCKRSNIKYCSNLDGVGKAAEEEIRNVF